MMRYNQRSCKSKSILYAFYSTLILITVSLFVGWFIYNKVDEKKQSLHNYFTPTLPPSQVPSIMEEIPGVLNPNTMERIRPFHQTISNLKATNDRYLQSRPSLSPSLSNSQTIHFKYALEFNFVGPPAIVIPDFKRAVETEIINTLNNIGFEANFISSVERTTDLPGRLSKYDL